MFDSPEQAEKLQGILSRFQKPENQAESTETESDGGPEVEILKPNDNYEEEGNFPDGQPDIEDYVLWPGGPLQSQVEAWVKEFNSFGLDVGICEFPTGERFVWRCISRAEYKAIMAAPNTTPLIREEMIVELCTLWPENFDYEAQASGKAGIPGALAKIYMRSSGFVEPRTSLL